MQVERTGEVLAPAGMLAEPALLAPAKLTFVQTLPHFVVLCLQLTLVLLVIRGLHVEEDISFFTFMSLTFAGFVVHAWLPFRFRLPFFTLLSLSGVVVLLGWSNGFGVLALGGLLFAICRLPVPLLARIVLLLIVGGLLAAARLGAKEPLWPVLGSMFMFRVILYLFETRQGPPPPLVHSLAYFFPLPNACFTFFPVLDFQTFRDTYYNDRPYTIYQSGVNWIVRGLGHLLAYRAIKYYLMPAPHETHDLPHAALYIAATYALYLHVSGWFHIIAGTLHLFGFNLPRTHNNYFIATSCTDIWRRINIYWKDFLAKVVFFPIFFALRGQRPRLGMTVAGLGVFVATWLLHSYQAFWLRGTLSLRLDEAVLWLTAGVCTVVNVQWDLRRPSRAQQEQRLGTVGGALRWTLQVAGMFTLISLFWAWWNIPHFITYARGIVSAPLTVTLSGMLTLAAVLVVLLTLGVVAQLLWQRWLAAPVLSWSSSPALHTVALLLLAMIAFPRSSAWLGSRAEQELTHLRYDVLTSLEAQQMAQGYYEELTEANQPARPWAVPLPEIEQQSAAPYMAMTRPVDDWQGRELIPGWSGEIGGSHLTVNNFGMRDRAELTQAKPPNTCRIALVGSSVVMGYGVGDKETFARLLQERLNAVPPTPGLRYEVLNFGAGQSHAINRRVVIDRKVWPFEPDALYYVAHQDEITGTIKHLAQLVAQGKKPLYPDLGEIIRKADITSETAPGLSEIRLQPLVSELFGGIYTSIVSECRARGVVPVWIYLPIPGVSHAELHSLNQKKVRETGFGVIDLEHWAKGYAPKEVMNPGVPLDFHPNPKGHRLIAEQLEAQIRQRPELLPRQPGFHDKDQ